MNALKNPTRLSGIFRKVEGNCPGEKGLKSDGNPVMMFNLAGYLKNDIDNTRASATLPGGASVDKYDLSQAMYDVHLDYMLNAPGKLKEASYFVLLPGQSIGEHRHTSDMEWWIVTWVDKEGHYHIKVSFCPAGESHKWPVNNYGVPLSFIALKWWVPSDDDAAEK